MDWQFTEDRPIWQQITEQLTLRILKGEYPPGERLPGVRELAAQAGVNPNTMQRALAELENDGLAVTNRTAGRLVTTDTSVVEKVRDALASKCIITFYEGMAQLGYDRAEAKRKLEETKEDAQ